MMLGRYQQAPGLRRSVLGPNQLIYRHIARNNCLRSLLRPTWAAIGDASPSSCQYSSAVEERSRGYEHHGRASDFTFGNRPRFERNTPIRGLNRGSRSPLPRTRENPFISRSRYSRDSQRQPSKRSFPVRNLQSDEIVEGTAGKQDEYVMKFAELKTAELVAPILIDTFTEDMSMENLTPVQSQTISRTLKGIDIVAQARTGTGKTLGFLIPILQKILADNPGLSQRKRKGWLCEPDIKAVIISPTRELAEQIAAEAKRAAARTAIVVQTAVGGTRKKQGLDDIMTRGCHILVGTPGRLKDIFSDPMANLDLSKVNSFVLDEADRLLDDGFYPEIQDIANFLPAKETRQNMLFSATMPRDVLNLAQQVLNDNQQFVQTIQKGEIATHEKIPQHLVLLNGLENQLPALLELILRQKDRNSEQMPLKALVFLNSTLETTLYAEIFTMMRRHLNDHLRMQIPILEIHSQKTQAARTKTADLFRRSSNAIMFTTDVSARGMDYPNVSHVIQLGLPRDRDFYIHRLGRTGRKEQSGEGWLFLSPFELGQAQKQLRNLPLKENSSLATAHVDMNAEDDIESAAQEIIKTSRLAAQRTDPALRRAANSTAGGYFSWVENQRALRTNLYKQLALSWGLDPSSRDETLDDGPRFAGRGKVFGSDHSRNIQRTRFRRHRPDASSQQTRAWA